MVPDGVGCSPLPKKMKHLAAYEAAGAGGAGGGGAHLREDGWTATGIMGVFPPGGELSSAVHSGRGVAARSAVHARRHRPGRDAAENLPHHRGPTRSCSCATVRVLRLRGRLGPQHQGAPCGWPWVYNVPYWAVVYVTRLRACAALVRHQLCSGSIHGTFESGGSVETVCD